MYISTLGLVLLVVLLTWPTQQVDDLVSCLFKLALGLAGAILAGVALWFTGRFLMAHWAEILVCGSLFVIWLASKLNTPLPRHYHAADHPVYRDSDFEAWRKARGDK